MVPLLDSLLINSKRKKKPCQLAEVKPDFPQRQLATCNRQRSHSRHWFKSATKFLLSIGITLPWPWWLRIWVSYMKSTRQPGTAYTEYDASKASRPRDKQSGRAHCAQHVHTEGKETSATHTHTLELRSLSRKAQSQPVCRCTDLQCRWLQTEWKSVYMKRLCVCCYGLAFLKRQALGLVE